MNNNEFNNNEFDRMLSERLKDRSKARKKIKREEKIESLKGSTVRAVSISLVGVTSFLSLIGIGGCKKKTENVATSTDASEVCYDDNYGMVSADSLGLVKDDLSLASVKSEKFRVISGDINSEEIVRDSNGTLWATKEDAEKSSSIGKSTIDTQNGKYEVVTNKSGKTVVIEKETGVQITDEEGNTKSTKLNSDGVPEGYHKESDGTILKDGYTIAEKDYYGSDGSTVIEKGDVISESTEKKADKELYTSKKDIPETTTKTVVKEEISTFSEEEINRQIEEKLKEMGITDYGTPEKVESTTKKEETTTKAVKEETTTKAVKEETTTKKEETTTKKEETTTKKEETTTSVSNDAGKVNSNGTYTIYGMTFESKADYQQWVINGYEGYGEKNGIMVPEDKEMKEAYSEYQKTLK